MSSALQQFFGEVKTSINNNDLSAVLSINPAKARHIPILQRRIQERSNDQLMADIEQAAFYQGEWASFEVLLHSYLIFVRDFNPWSLLDSIDLFIRFYESLSIALNNLQHNSMLLSLVRESTNTIVPIAKLVDEKVMQINNRSSDYPRLSHISTILLKSLNNLRSDPELNVPSNRYKISVMMFLSCTLCKTYISIDSIMLCNNVFSNINILSLDKTLLSRKQLIQYRFILGKFHLLQSNYYLAYHHFNWCFNNCHQSTPRHILASILRYLIPSGLLVGKCPDLVYLRSILGNLEVLQLYERLIPYYKNGDLFNFSRLVQANEAYFVRLGILVSFLQRARLLLFRNLVHKVYKITGGNLTFARIRTALELSLNPSRAYIEFAAKSKWLYVVGVEEPNDFFVENLLITLIDSNLVKAKLTTSRTIILSKTGSFPKVFKIYEIKYLRNDKESWMD